MTATNCLSTAAFPRMEVQTPGGAAVATGFGPEIASKSILTAPHNTSGERIKRYAIFADPVPLRVDERGAIRVGNTRIAFDHIVSDYQRGETPEAIVESYDVLELADVYAAIAYYLRHKEEVDHYLHHREEEAAQLRQVIEANQRPGLTKAELLRRWAERNPGHAPPGQ